MQKADWEKGDFADREVAKGLVRDFPDYFALRGSEEYLEFIGMSADDILENYIKEQGGKERGSKLWHRLACMVVARGEREKNDLI